jgi:hypothetical protein
VFVLRCTKKLLDRLPPRSGGEGEERASDTRLGDWTANLFFIGRHHLVLGVNNKTLLPVLLPIAPNKTFIPRFVEAAGEMLMALGIDRKAVLAEMAAMGECIVAATNDRRVLGSINDFGRMLEVYLDGRALPKVALHLADAPCSPIGMDRPRDAARELFAQSWIRSNEPNLRLVKGQPRVRRGPSDP